MAGPAAHIFCALSVLNSGALKISDPKAFIVGTSFPNIRYLGDIQNVLSRKKKATWTNIKNEPSSFKAGLYLHALVDEVKERYLVESGFYEKLPRKKNLEYAIKLYEDMIVYGWVDNWKTIVGYFDAILEQEQQFNINHARLALWHTCLQQYLVTPPTREYATNLFIKLHPTFSNMLPLLKPFSVAILKYYVNTLMDILEQSPETKEIITSFYKNCVELITR